MFSVENKQTAVSYSVGGREIVTPNFDLVMVSNFDRNRVSPRNFLQLDLDNDVLTIPFDPQTGINQTIFVVFQKERNSDSLHRKFEDKLVNSILRNKYNFISIHKIEEDTEDDSDTYNYSNKYLMSITGDTPDRLDNNIKNLTSALNILYQTGHIHNTSIWNDESRVKLNDEGKLVFELELAYL